MHTLKILEQDDQTAIVGGYGVVFGGADLEGETFAADTDFMLDLVPVKPVYIDHSEDTFVTADGKTVKLLGIHEPVGQVLEVAPDDTGLYMRLQFDKAGRYWSVVEQMIASGKAGLSSGTVGHLARRKGSRIVRWPIVEESITLTPAEPRTVGIERLKALVALNPGLKAVIPEAASETAEDDAGADESLDARCRRIIDAFMTAYPAPQVGVNEYEYLDWWVVEVFETYLIARLDKGYWQVGYTENGRTVGFAARDSWVPVKEHREWVEAVKSFRAKSRKSIVVTEKNEMAELDATPGADDLNAKVDALSEAVNKITKVLEDSPALKRAGYTTDDGGTADPTHKSFGDYLLAIKRGDTKRLGVVYGATKDMAEGSGVTGGYLVPSEFHNELLRVTAEQSPIYARVRKQPVSTDAGEFPALDTFVAPTAGSGETAAAGGVKAKTKAETATLDETEPKFTNLEYRIHKVGGYVEVSNELIADSPQSIEALLRSLFGIAIGSKNERNILRGTGAGEPLGIFNAPCTIGVTTVTNDVFAYADVLAMWARFKAVSGGSPVWIAHPSLIPQIGTLAVAAGSPVVWAGNLAAGQPNTLLGYPILFSEHMPQWKSSDMLLADLGAYVMFEREALSIAFSEHAAFTSDKGTWRFTSRNDGKPWLKNAITLADPTGSYTVGPFVYHND